MVTIPRTNLEIFPLNLGGNTFGWTSDRDTSFAVLDAFVAAGGNFIDTSDIYSMWGDGLEGGESETVMGEWIAARGNRDQVIIATKVGGLPERPGLSAENVEAALTESLERLQTDYIDIYYAHYDDENVAIADQVRHAHSLIESGRIRHIALSNFSPERMREWFETATDLGLTLPIAIQPQYSLLHRKDFEQNYAAIAREFGAAVFSYFSLASGVLTGKYRSKADLEGRARASFAEHFITDDAMKVIDELVEIAASHNAEPATVALAWLVAKGVTAPIASASTPEQLPALMAVNGLQLSDSEIERLDSASQPFA